MNEKEKKRRRFYLVLPLLVVPFLAITFWLFGGGASATPSVTGKKGLNTVLPSPQNQKDSGRDKMSFYELAIADSMKRNEQLQNDPNLKNEQKITAAEITEEREIYQAPVRAIRARIKIPEYTEEVERKVVKELPNQYVPPKPQPDPEIEAINQTIEKLAALQNPSKPVEKIAPETRREVFNVNSAEANDESYFGKKQTSIVGNKFLNEKTSDSKNGLSFSAFVPSDQVLQNGSVMRLQLSQPISVKGVLLPLGTTLYGSVKIESERIFVTIANIQFAGNIYPVSLTVFDLDGIEGLYVPGSPSRDQLKSTAEQSLQSVNVLSVDPSIKTQALTAGIGLTKSLLSRKVKAVRLTISAGYRVLLHESKMN